MAAGVAEDFARFIDAFRVQDDERFKWMTVSTVSIQITLKNISL